MNKRELIILELTKIKEGENLFDLAMSFKKDGMKQKEMLALFDTFREQFENDTDEKNYNAITDTMDYIFGWCNEKDRIFR